MSDLTTPDGKHDRETLMLMRRAIAEGWQIPADVMASAPKYARDIMINGDAREKLRAIQALNQMRDSNIQAIQALDKIERLEGGAPTEIFTLGKIEL